MTNQIIPFSFESTEVRVVTIAGDPWFVAKDVALALGYINHSDAIAKHCKGVAKRYPLQTSGGIQEVRVINEPDVYRLVTGSNLPAAEKFEAWIFEEVLPSIRKTGGYIVAPSPSATVIPATKEFEALFSVAKLLGLDKNASAISANNATRKITGVNLLNLLGQDHLTAEVQQQVLTPTEIAQRLGLGVRKINPMLIELGLQISYKNAKGDITYELTDAGRKYGIYYDTAKKHGDGTPIRQLKWFESVLPILKNA